MTDLKIFFWGCVTGITLGFVFGVNAAYAGITCTRVAYYDPNLPDVILENGFVTAVDGNGVSQIAETTYVPSANAVIIENLCGVYDVKAHNLDGFMSDTVSNIDLSQGPAFDIPVTEIGDINQDGEINLGDLLLLQRRVLE